MLVLAIILIIWLLIAPGVLTFRISDKRARGQFAEKGLELHIKDLKINNRNIHYVLAGNDGLPTFIFLHGSPSSWKAFIEYLQDPGLLQNYRMVSIDRPGFGGSDFGDAVNLKEQTQLMLPVLKEIENGKPVFLVGHSLGVPLILKMAADYPAGVDGIMLLSGSVDPVLEPKEGWRGLLESIPLKYFVPGAFRPSNTELIYFKKDVVELTEDFPKVKCAVWLVHGEKDTWVPPGNSDYAKRKLVNAKKVEVTKLPGADHFIPWTRKSEITGLMLQMGQP